MDIGTEHFLIAAQVYSHIIHKVELIQIRYVVKSRPRVESTSEQPEGPDPTLRLNDQKVNCN